MSEPTIHNDPRPDELDRLLAGERIAVRQGFTAEVMARLPQPSWAKRGSRVWWVAAAVAVVLLTAASWLLARDPGSRAVFGSLAAIGDLLVTTLVVGAGMLSASWSGLRTLFGDAFGQSPLTLAAFGLLVVALNGLLFRMLRRRTANAVERRRDGR